MQSVAYFCQIGHLACSQHHSTSLISMGPVVDSNPTLILLDRNSNSAPLWFAYLLFIPGASWSSAIRVAQEFRWGDFASSIQWADFYSDCEHEVLEVTSGFRVTLTYDLSWTNAPAPLVNPFMHEQSLPVFAHLQAALRDPNFCAQGGLLGFHCAHLYPRNR
jgi:hypothetical protein